MYDAIAHYYDLIHSDLTEDIEFILRQASEIDAPLLELGFGTGRLAIPLAEAGHRVTGLDRSGEMLRFGREKITALQAAARERINIVEDNLADFKLDHQYGMVLIGHNTFMHVRSQELESTLMNIRAHMQVGGVLLIDVDNPTEFADPSLDYLVQLERTFRLPQSGDIVTQMTSSWTDPDRQICRTTWIFESSPANGGSTVRQVVETDFFYYYAHQLEVALLESGFNVDNFWGDYDESPYSEDSRRLIIAASAV